MTASNYISKPVHNVHNYGRHKPRKPTRRRKSPGQGMLLSALLAIGLLSGVYATADRWLQAPLWQYLKGIMILKNIKVQGNQHLSTQEILSIAGIEEQIDILSIDLAEIREHLEQNPWVERAEVRRIVPDLLVIQVQEAVPAAVWHNKNEMFLVSKQGKVLDKINDIKEYKNYLMLFGTNAPAEYIKIYDTLYRSAFFNDILSISRVGNRRWDVYLRKRIVIKLPEKAQNEVIAAATTLLSKNAEEGRELQILDLRLFPEKVFVKYYAKAAQ